MYLSKEEAILNCRRAYEERRLGFQNKAVHGMYHYTAKYGENIVCALGASLPPSMPNHPILELIKDKNVTTDDKYFLIRLQNAHDNIINLQRTSDPGSVAEAINYFLHLIYPNNG